jgi:enoyl-CoA hydratase/carnithine racemase
VAVVDAPACRPPQPRLCRVTFDHPPINTITATTVAELADLVELIEDDQDLKVVVFASANPDF